MPRRLRRRHPDASPPSRCSWLAPARALRRRTGAVLPSRTPSSSSSRLKRRPFGCSARTTLLQPAYNLRTAPRLAPSSMERGLKHREQFRLTSSAQPADLGSRVSPPPTAPFCVENACKSIPRTTFSMFHDFLEMLFPSKGLPPPPELLGRGQMGRRRGRGEGGSGGSVARGPDRRHGGRRGRGPRRTPPPR